MIYSASRRTDLVAFHPDWLAGRLARARKLDAVVYWTKDPRPLLRHPGLRRALARYPAVLQLTVTGRGGTPWEPRVPPPAELADALAELARILPPGALVWRFDPVAIDPSEPEEALFARFDAVHALWEGAAGPVREFTASFLDFYPRVRAQLAAAGLAARDAAPGERRRLLTALWRRLDDPEATVGVCCEPELLAECPFARPARCVDGARFDRLYGTTLGDLPRDAGQRGACACARSTDIGDYAQACGHGCVYCYARHAAGGGE